MNTDKQRIAIAEACGWTDVRVRVGISGFSPGFDPNKDATRLPDYLNDLNAMHEAEKATIVKLQLGQRYHEVLDELCGNDHGVYHATAAQRAEAFLKTLNLWTETPCTPTS